MLSLASMLALRLAACSFGEGPVAAGLAASPSSPSSSPPSASAIMGMSMRGGRLLCKIMALATLCRRAALRSGSTAPLAAASAAAATAAVCGGGDREVGGDGAVVGQGTRATHSVLGFNLPRRPRVRRAVPRRLLCREVEVLCRQGRGGT